MERYFLPAHIYRNARRHGLTLARDRRGAIALITLIAFPVLAGFVGLGIDVSVWYAARRDLQTAADAAAIAAAYEITNNPNGLTVAARNDAIRNGFDPNATGSQITVNRPPTSGANAGNTSAVEVVVQRQSNLFLSSLLFNETVVVRVRAVANTSVDDEFCVLGLDPTRDKAVDLSGNATATFNCGIAVNSNDSAALFAGGSVVASASSANVVGGINEQGNASFTTTEPAQTGSRPVDDPYADLTVPTLGGCDFNNKMVQGTETLAPGTYCGGIRFNGGANATLQAGTYFLDRGDFKSTGNTTISGNGVTIVLTSSTGNGFGNIALAGGTTIGLTAPTTGQYTGVAFYQDRAAPSTQGNQLILNSILGGATTDIQGAIYVPSQELVFSGGSGSGNGCTQLVARKVSLGGNTTIDSNCAGAGTRAIGQRRIRLRE